MSPALTDSSTPTAVEIQLFSRPECHLCDDAMVLIETAGLGAYLTVVDIEPDLQLLSRYGDKIPVLRWPDGSELFWPFTVKKITDAHNRFIQP